MSILHTCAAEWVQWVEMSFCVVRPAEPAPFMSTYGAWHVITSRNFLNNGAAFVTLLYRGRVLPCFYFVFEDWLTAIAFMRLAMAFYAYFCCTFWAFKFVFLYLLWFFISRYNHWTFRIGTPHKIGVLLHLCIMKKLLVNTIRFRGSKALNSLCA